MTASEISETPIPTSTSTSAAAPRPPSPDPGDPPAQTGAAPDTPVATPTPPRASPPRHPVLRRCLTIPLGVVAAAALLVVSSTTAVLGAPAALRPGSRGRTVRLSLFTAVLTLVELVGLLAVLTVRLTTFSRSRRAARHLSLLNTLLGFALQTANVFLSAEPAAAAEAPDLRADEPLVLNAVLAWDPLTDLLVGPLPHSFEAGAAVLDGTGPRHHQHPSSLSVVDLWRAIPSASAIHLSRTTRRSPAAGS